MIACVLIPGFLVAVERQLQPALRSEPVVIYASSGAKRYIYSLCREALQAGIVPGMPLRQANTLCPEASFIAANPPRYREALTHLTDTLALFSDQLEVDGLPRFGKHWRRRSGLPAHHAAYHAIAYLDLGSLSPADTVNLSRQLQRAVETYQHLQASVGLAQNPFTAYVAARLLKPGQLHAVRSGEEAGFLMRRPVSLLPLKPEIARRLRLFGIQTLGAFAALPPGAVLAQFGKAGRRLHQMARGADDRVVPRYQPRRETRVRQAFDDPLPDESFVAPVVALLTLELAQRLAQTAERLRSLRLTLTRDDGSAEEAELTLRQPSGDQRHLQEVSTQLLQRFTVQRNVTAVELVASDLVTCAHRQLTLFDEDAGEAQAQQVLHDLMARFGDDVFLQASLLDTAALLSERRFELETVSAA